MNLSDISIRHPVFSWMVMIGLIFFGFFSYRDLSVNRNPDVDYPSIGIRINLEGAAPEVIEKNIIDPIEEVLVSINGIDHIYSSARSGSAQISVDFNLDKNIDVAAQEVQNVIAKIQRNLPQEATLPSITKSNPDDRPILWFALRTENLSKRETMLLVKNQIKDQFSVIKGVSEVVLGGYSEPIIKVDILSEKLRGLQLTAEDVMTSIQSEHREVPAGRIESEKTEESVRVLGEALDLKELASLSINKRGGNPIFSPFKLSDVADVSEGLADVRRISRYNGAFSVGIGIKKQRGANAVEVAHEAKKKAIQINKQLPSGSKLLVNFDSTPFIEEAIKELLFTLVLAAFLTAIVCWLFLGSLSSTLNVVLAIPTSIIGAFIFFKYFGFSLNFFSLLGLILAIGIVVDDAIIVLENIVRHRNLGKDKLQAALQGSQEITFAVLVTTVAIIAVFAPVMNVKGVLGKFLYEFAAVLCLTVALSCFEALSLTPMRCSQFLSNKKGLIDPIVDGLKNRYITLLTFCLQNRIKTLLFFLVFFITSLFSLNLIKKEFVPAQDESALFIYFKTKQGSSLKYTDEKIREVEKYVITQDFVERYYVAIGGFGGGESNAATMFLTLKSKSKRNRDPETGKHPSQQDIAVKLRRDFKKILDLQAFVQDTGGGLFGSRGGFPIEFSLRGPNWESLINFSEKLKIEMDKSGYFSDVMKDDTKGALEYQIVPHREKAQRLGVEIFDITRMVEILFGGLKAGVYTQMGSRFDILVRLNEAQRESINDLNKIQVRNNRGELISLKELVTIEKKQAPFIITREDRARALKFSASPASHKSQKEALDKLEEIASETLPHPYHIAFTGAALTFKDSFQSLIYVLIIGLIVAYMVLASQFNSFMDPFIVLGVLPFGLSGALITLWMTQQSINIYSVIGLVLLMGIAKKNSILIVEFTNQLIHQGKDLRTALLMACPIRFRPILMTSLATLVAALPAAINFGPGAESRIPMAMVIIGGTLVSTLASLFVVPCFHDLIHQLRARNKSIKLKQ